jgi:thiamine biosynthesis lipoprotein
MGCHMLAMLDASEDGAAEYLSQVSIWFEEWEQVLSRFRLDSDLNRLNRSAGRPLQVSQILWDVFESALEAERASAGLVTATILPALLAAGYDRSFDQMLPEIQGIPFNDRKMVTSLAESELDPANRTIHLPADVQVDFGGLAKGWAAWQAAQRISKFGPALVNAGGDIAISAELTNGKLWPVTVDDPFHAGEIIATLGLRACGVATSGIDFRRWKRNGEWNHHIIDPRTGRPAQTDLSTVTVVAQNATLAEMAAKTILILGSQPGMAWVNARPEFSALLVRETGEILLSDLMEQHFWRSDEYEHVRPG